MCFMAKVLQLKEMCRMCFAKFKTGYFNLEDQERLGRSFTADEDQIKILIENNPRYTTRKLAENVKIHHPRAFCEAWLHKPF